MKIEPTKILLIEDNPGDARLVQEAMAEAGTAPFDLALVKTLAKGLSSLKKNPVDIVLLDLTLPDSSGFETFQKVYAQVPHLPIILLTGFDDDIQAAQAVREGAQDYLVKGQVSGSLLVRSIRYAIERKRAEEALHQSEEKYRGLFENSLEGIGLSRGNQIIDANRALLVIFGYEDLQEFLTVPLLDLVAPESRDFIAEILRKAKAGEPYETHYLYKIIRKDGQVRDVEISTEHIKIGDEVYTQGTFRDVTERKQAEEELTFRNILLATQQEVSIDGILMVDDNNVIISYNRRFVEMLGIPQELIEKRAHKPVLRFVTNKMAHPRQFLQRVQYLYDHRLETSNEEIELKDGKIFERYSAPMFGAGDRYHGRVWYFHDITARKRAQAAQQESELLFRGLFELSPDAIVLIDPNDPAVSWPIIDCNEAACKMNGYQRDELIGQSIDILNAAPYTLDGRNAYLRQLKETGNLYLETNHRHKNGTVFPVEISTKLIMVGERKLIIGIDRDITERKRAEEALRAASSYNRRLIEASIDPLVTIGQDGKITDANAATESVTGVSRDRLIGDDFSNYFLEPEKAKEGYQRALAEALVKDFPLTIQHTSGKTTDVLYNAAVYKNEAGEIQGVFAAARDITERKQAEEALHESEARYRLLYELSPDAIAVYQSGEVIFANPAAVKLLGAATQEELIGKPVMDYVHPDSRQQVMERMRQQMDDGKIVPTIEEKFIRLDGSVIDVDVTAAPIRFQNALSNMVIVRDITERKQAEEALRKSEENYRGAISAAGLVPYVIDYNTKRFTFMGENILKLTGYPAEEITPDILKGIVQESHVFGPDNADLTPAEAQKKFRSGKLGKWGNDLRIRTRSGEERWLSDVSVPLFDNLGKVTRAIGIFQDLTDRKHAEDSLRESEERFREIFENMSSGVVVYEAVNGGKDFKINNFNRAAEKIEKIPRETVIGKLVTKTFPGVKEFGLFEIIRRVWETGKPDHFPIGFYKDARISGWRENYLARLPSGEVLTVYDDVTERKQAEQALREGEERFRIIFENANDAIFIENDNDQILSVNPRACEMLGYSSEELIKMHVPDVQAPEVRQPGSLLPRELSEHGTSNFEGLDLHSSGRRIPVEISVGRIERPSGDLYVSIVRDITERKRAETALAVQAEELRRRNEELARLYRASGSLISGASLNLQEQAQKIVEVVQQEFGQDNCSLLIVSRNTNELMRLATAGPYADQVRHAKLTLDGEGLVARSMRAGKTVNVPNVLDDPHYVPNWEAAHSELTVPLKIGNNVIGAIDVQSPEQNAFSPDDERLMTIFAERAALVLEHSRLNTQTEVRIQQLVALRTIDMAISSSFDINLTLGILLDQVTGHLGVHAADILIFNAATQTFKLAVERGFRTKLLQHTQLNLGMGYAWRAVRDRQMVVIPNLQVDPGGIQRTPYLAGEQFVAYLGVPLIAKGQVRGILEIFHREPVNLEPERVSFLELLAGQAAIAIDNVELFDNLQMSNSELSLAYDSTLEGWASALELRDHDTAGHTRRTTDLTVRIAQSLGVKNNEIVHIYRGALLHDIGKMGVPDSIVLKPGPLTEDEWVSMRKHPQYAHDLLSPISFLRQALDIPYCHHEKWDGTGYPRGLKGEKIPLSARVFAVVDVWDALTSDRPYRKAWPPEKAYDFIRENSGSHFDPKIVEIFLREVKLG